MMSYKRTIEFLYNQLPMFQRIGAAAYKADLSNTLAICALLGNPEKSFRSVHIAGTNGKGSVSHFLASVLQEAGYKTGLFTSPHLKDFRERIRINGVMIPKSELIAFVKQYKEEFLAIKPSFFEWSWGLAAWYFAKSKVDIAVIETGMGGRLDSTNIIIPELSVITNISHDHNRFLGPTLRAIASEKAGIIKYNIPVVVSEKQPGVAEVFRKKAIESGSELRFASDHFRVIDSGYLTGVHAGLRLEVWDVASQKNLKYISALSGIYQLKNIPCVLSSVKVLRDRGFEISERNVSNGIRKVIANTGLKGRWQILGLRPLTIADIAHNPAGIAAVIRQAASVNKQKLHIVLGVVNDKDVRKMLSILPDDAVYYFCKADIPRGLDAQKLSGLGLARGLKGTVCSDVKMALQLARNHAGQDDTILITGSAFVVAEVV